MDALPLILLLPFAGSLVLALMPDEARNACAWLAGVVAAASAVLVVACWPPVADGEVLKAGVAWLPQHGLDFSLRMDGLAWLFSMIVSGIGVLVVLYARYYLSPEDPAARFYAFLLAFMGAMLGVVLAGNLVLLVVFWELTSLTSFLLIGYWRHRVDAREGARMALTITGAGGLALLAGVLVLGHIVGSFDLDAVLAAGDVIRAHPAYGWAVGLVLLGALTKSAQFPFHFWLPHAMAAPTPVSAYLHSATMVKAGVFLLARFWPALAGTDTWFWIVAGAGLTTLVMGAYIAVFQHDLKGLLAYSTISHLGLITLLFGLNSPLAAVAGVFHIMNHATFKASLFMAAGIIDHETGSRDMRRLNGLWRAMPITGTLVMVASAAMAGVPLLNGFLSKEMMFAETLSFADSVRLDPDALLPWVVPAAATVAGLLSVAYSLRFVHDVFFNGPPMALAHTPHEPPRWMRWPVEFLVLLCVLVGALPALVVGPLLAVAAAPVVGGTLPDYSLSVWHGFNLPLLMSVIALVGGATFYFWLQRRFDLHTVDLTPLVARLDGKRKFDNTLDGVLAGARRVSGLLESGRLQSYLAVLVAGVIGVGAWALLRAPGPLVPAGLADAAATPTSPVLVAVWLIGVLGAVGTVVTRHDRLVALAFAGVAGLVVGLAFVWFSAPDLAMTQLLVEVVTIVLMMLALGFLPRKAPLERARGDRGRQWVHAALAVAAGVGMSVIAWSVLVRPFPQSISPFYLETTVPEGGGSNTVNVILVDYRGFDTMGEIAVLGIAGLVIAGLLARVRLHRRGGAQPHGEARPHPILLGVVVRLLLPLAAVVSIYLFLRGHNLPGGGFVAGLVLSVALLLQYVAFGVRQVESARTLVPQRWVGLGLAIAIATGVAAWAFGFPFLTSAHIHPILPVVGELPLASAAGFDLGVMMTVVGATLLSLVSIGRLARPSDRGERP